MVGVLLPRRLELLVLARDRRISSVLVNLVVDLF
jgi:hypothetical protein